MARYTATEAKDKWTARMQASIDYIGKGVDKVTESPMLKAAAKKDKMLSRLTKAVNDGKWEAGLKRVSLDSWKKSFKEKGLNRINAGVVGASDKMEAFYDKLLPYQDKLKAELKTMPDLTLEDSIARMTKFVRGMANFSNAS